MRPAGDVPGTYAEQIIKPSLDKIRNELRLENEDKRLLFSVEHVHVHQLLLYLLEVMMRERGWRGILVSVDRPHNYITRLLKGREINIDRLTIIDVVTSLVHGDMTSPDNVMVLRSPFGEDLKEELTEALIGDRAEKHGIDLSSTHFIIFDNIAVLHHYQEMIHIKRTFMRLEKLLGEYPYLKSILLLDIERQRKVYEAFQGWSEKEIVL